MYQIYFVRNGKENSVTGKKGESLMRALQENDIYISAACGGKGRCGHCGVRMIEGATPATEADHKFYSQEQIAEGMRLSCESYPQADCRIIIDMGDEADFEIVSDYQSGKTAQQSEADAESAYYIAIDIGTTTVAVSLVGKDSKEVKHTETIINHQRAYGADVISRIQAANDGQLQELSNSIRKDLKNTITKLLEVSGVALAQVERIAIAGNTTMGHLLMGYSCETLGVFPFTPVNIDTIESSYKELFDATATEDIAVVLLPGISTYVGADISAGMLSCGMDQSDKVNILVDLGTNGEMGIGNKDKIMVTSTAAGPAFEGGNILWGMGSVQGAICKIEIEDTACTYDTIGDAPAIGLCGTGVIETVYELIQAEWVDETGMLDEDYFDDGFPLAQTPKGEDIVFTQKDVREIQLAKSAVRAGLETLMLRYGVGYEDIGTLYLAGGFGFRMNLEKAVGIGLLPEALLDRMVAVGNSSLGGAVQYLTQEDSVARMEKIIAVSEEIGLASDKDFNNFYTQYMFFE